MTPRVSVVVPAYNEGAAIGTALDRILGSVKLSCEVLVVYDSPEDTTAPHVMDYSVRDARVVPVLNTWGRGPARAISYAMAHASADVVVVTMADGSDDPRQIDELAALIETGASVASASRYSRGGSKVGGPRLKGLLSRFAGVSLAVLAKVGTRDATNSFKAYATPFLRSIPIESTDGFELALELVAKAHRLGLEVREIPTVWRDRTEGESHFKLSRWLPKYLRWYVFAFGRRLTRADLMARARIAA